MSRRGLAWAFVLVLVLVAQVALAADPAPASPIGHRYAPQAFAPTALPPQGNLDRLIVEFDLLEGEPLAMRRENFDADPLPEWLVVSPDRRCGLAGCVYLLFDHELTRELGRFTGTLLVLDRQHNGHAVIQTINRQDEDFSSLRTYLFSEQTYQLDDDVLIGETARRATEAAFVLTH